MMLTVGIDNTNELQKETSKFYLPIMLTVGIEFMTTEKKYKMKYKL